jgi:hypothetical protein
MPSFLPAALLLHGMSADNDEATLIRLIEEGISQIAKLSAHRFRFVVDSVERLTSPRLRLKADATLFFLRSGEPFCCGEPGCYSEVFLRPNELLGEFLSTHSQVRGPMTIALETTPAYFEGIRFTALK